MEGKEERQDKKELDIEVDCRENACKFKDFPVTSTYKSAKIKSSTFSGWWDIRFIHSKLAYFSCAVICEFIVSIVCSVAINMYILTQIFFKQLYVSKVCFVTSVQFQKISWANSDSQLTSCSVRV